MNWTLSNNEINRDDFADRGNRYLIANGYAGVRGTLDESGKEELAAVNLAGIYDKVGDGWREPLNAPNPFHTATKIDGTQLTVEKAQAHSVELDFRYGLFKRNTQWLINDNCITVKSTRFASMDQVHLFVSKYEVSVTDDALLEVIADIDTDIWEIYGPHYEYFELSHSDNMETCLASVQNSGIKVAVARKLITNMDFVPEWINGFKYLISLKAGESFSFYSYSSIYTTNDDVHPLLCAKNELEEAKGYEALLSKHKDKWENIWKHGQVTIEGNDEAEVAINYSLYHLNSIAPRHSDRLSIPARGLSGQTYKGAIFWDSEMFMLDYFLYTQPEVAKSLINYRIDTLNGAKDKAKEYGFEGAFYAWESQEGGFDGCSDYNVTCVFTHRPMRTYFRDKQVHISSAVASAIMRYVEVTGDYSVLSEGGAETIFECAKFYASLLIKYANKDCYEIHDCIGPDEYHERINNNAYTNRMAKATFDYALKVLDILKRFNPVVHRRLKDNYDEKFFNNLKEYSADIKLKMPNENGIIEQFDGYFDLEDASVEEVKSRLLNEKEYWGGAYGVASHTKVIKQADVVTMLEIFHKEYEQEILKKNWEYYEPFTEHGSSLSACMYALLACRFNEPNKAYPFFLKSATSDLKGGGKQWAGLVYIGGTHPAAEGGAWMVLAKGFAGLCVKDGKINVEAHLPKDISAISFMATVQGKEYKVKITKNEAVAMEAMV